MRRASSFLCTDTSFLVVPLFSRLPRLTGFAIRRSDLFPEPHRKRGKKSNHLSVAPTWFLFVLRSFAAPLYCGRKKCHERVHDVMPGRSEFGSVQNRGKKSPFVRIWSSARRGATAGPFLPFDTSLVTESQEHQGHVREAANQEKGELVHRLPEWQGCDG